jgi:plastocyanin
MDKNGLLPSKRMRLCWAVLSLTIVATFLVVACGGTPTSPIQPSATHQAKPSPTLSLTPVAVVNVKIIDKDGQYAFEPATLKIKVGTQVIWTNDSSAVHTVTSDTLLFNTNNLAINQVFTVTFTKPGTYPYYCNFHTNMIGTIIVTQ